MFAISRAPHTAGARRFFNFAYYAGWRNWRDFVKARQF
jgi:hypothetical protein